MPPPDGFFHHTESRSSALIQVALFIALFPGHTRLLASPSSCHYVPGSNQRALITATVSFPFPSAATTTGAYRATLTPTPTITAAHITGWAAPPT